MDDERDAALPGGADISRTAADTARILEDAIVAFRPVRAFPSSPAGRTASGGHDKYAYIAVRALERNPVVKRLCMSGECLCEAFVRKGELDEIAF